jgi:hypothetical protein
MADSPQGEQYPQRPAYPQGLARPSSTAQPTRPAAMRRAMFLMYAGAAVGVVGASAGALTRTTAVYSQTSTSISSNTSTVHYTSAPVFHSFASLVEGIITGVILGGLWLWMAWKTGAGRDWARALSSVFFGFACLQFVWSIVCLARPIDAVPLFIFSLAEWGFGLAALIQLWQREFSEFFAFAKQAKLAND